MFETPKYRPLSRRFFARPADIVARDLLGHMLVRVLDDGTVLAGRIVETEAYLAADDASAHIARGKTEVTGHLWGPPGYSYVYLCYGMYHCLNVVTEPEGRAGCVLFRAIEPLAGIEEMRRRRTRAKGNTELCSGPGRLCQALDIDVRLNRANMTSGTLYVAKMRKKPVAVGISQRVGIRKSVDLPLRFFVVGNPHVSRAKPGNPSRKRRSQTLSSEI